MLCSPTPSFCLFDSVWSRSSCCSRPLVPSFHGCAAARGPPYASPRSYGSSCSGDMVCSVWRCLRGSRRCCVSCVAAANGSGRSETGGPCSPTHRRLFSDQLKMNFLKEKEVRKGMGATSLNRRVKEVEPEEVQGRIMVACGWLVQGNFRAGAAARVPEQAPRHWRSVGRILETKVKEERPPTRRCGVGRRGRPAGRPQCGAGRRGNRPARRRCDAGVQAAVQGGDMTAELRLGRWRGKAGSGARDTIRFDFLFLRVG
ncbi:uncharacterized protein [Triticum aestivum]|uniref:uncharacterized protein isoform X2 n=1 Tax=Triticum aestivum TaxID=4565 RepID=UPI001D035707|nr:uncharacterized protein LOC123110642 isoform X2 [Triticum aestivum]